MGHIRKDLYIATNVVPQAGNRVSGEYCNKVHTWLCGTPDGKLWMGSQDGGRGGDLKGVINYPLIEKLKGQYSDRAAFITIGNAGEMKLLAASIACTDPEKRPTRHCGRGGTGAVMGSKRVKAIILDDTGLKMRPPKDPEKVAAAGPPDAAELRAFCRERLAGYKVPRQVHVRNELPHGPTGKVLKRALREPAT